MKCDDIAVRPVPGWKSPNRHAIWKFWADDVGVAAVNRNGRSLGARARRPQSDRELGPVLASVDYPLMKLEDSQVRFS